MKVNALAFAIMLFAKVIFAQGFVNLDFESAQVSGSAEGSYIPILAAIPGWNGYAINASTGTQSISQIYFNTRQPFIGLPPQISLQTNNSASVALGLLVIQGAYSALLESSWPHDFGSYAGIGQTGEIPADAQSLRFLGNFEGVITFAGHPIAYHTTGSFPNYSSYGADISTYAGQTGELLFSTPPGNTQFFFIGTLDNIQFSTEPVPEPAGVILPLFGLVIFLAARRRDAGGGH